VETLEPLDDADADGLREERLGSVRRKRRFGRRG